MNRRFRPLPALAAAMVLLAGCGSSSKPAYCASVANLKSEVKALPTTDVLQSGVGGLNSAVTKIRNDARQVVSDAKSDFPDETGALQRSVDSLAATVKQLQGSSPSPAVLAQLSTQVAAVASAVQQFASTTASKCG